MTSLLLLLLLLLLQRFVFNSVCRLLIGLTFTDPRFFLLGAARRTRVRHLERGPYLFGAVENRNYCTSVAFA